MVELLIVIAIVAILLAIALPSFRDVVERSRITSEVNSLLGSFQFARYEAIKRGAFVTICPIANPVPVPAACSGGNDWSTGWIVFNDIDGNGAVNGADTVLKRQAAWTSTDTSADVNKPPVLRVTYNRDGFATGLPASGMTLAVKTAPVNKDATRCLVVSVGRQVVQKPAQGNNCP